MTINDLANIIAIIIMVSFVLTIIVIILFINPLSRLIKRDPSEVLKTNINKINIFSNRRYYMSPHIRYEGIFTIEEGKMTGFLLTGVRKNFLDHDKVKQAFVKKAFCLYTLRRHNLL
jgi:hypothetical protein